MWPFTPGTTVVDELRRSIRDSYAYRHEHGIEPSSEQWTMLLSMGRYFMTVLPAGHVYQRVLDASWALVQHAESEMDFDTTAVAVAVMAQYVLPIHLGETDSAYQERVFDEYSQYMSNQPRLHRDPLADE